MRARPAIISAIILLETQTALWAHRGMLLACVVLIDLAIYITAVLDASGDIYELYVGAVAGYTRDTIRVQRGKKQAEVTGTFVIVESDNFTRFNLRRQV